MESIEKAIQSHETIDISEYLHALSHDPDEYINNLGNTITLLHKHKAPESVINNILSQWDLKDQDPDVGFLTAVETFACSNGSLRYIIENTSYISDIKYMIAQILDKPSFSQILNRLLYAYQDIMTNEDLIDLKEHLDMYEAKTNTKFPSVMNYIERTMKLKAKKPKWVSLQEGENKSHLKTVSLGLDLEDKDIFVKQLKVESKKLKTNKNLDDMIDIFSASISDTIDKDNSYSKSFRVWGPENRFKDRECVANPENKGPCRMLQCLCRDAEENEGDLPRDWFTGKCDSCNRIIQDLSHSVRYPAKQGGWKGCYCSFYCMSQTPPYQTNKEDNIRMKELDKKINEIGIMDRSLI